MIRKWAFRGLALILFAGLFASPVEGDASGCSWSSGTPSLGGCRSGSGSCYDCYYSGGGGGSHCYENGDGSITYCIDYQF